MRFQIDFSLDNEAFATEVPHLYRGDVVAGVLARVQARILNDPLRHGDGGPIFDINGNRVGEWRVALDNREAGR